MTTFLRKTYFDGVRASLFAGSLKSRQVDGQNFILDAWEKYVPDHDVRWLANFLAQVYHETSQEMWPIEEHGKGSGQPYGVPDPITGQTYYGRGFVQLTWKDNYQRADVELHLAGDASCVAHADQQLDPAISARTGYRGMMEAWFRQPHCFAEYFSETADDPYNSRDIVNGDKDVVPGWSDGRPIGRLVEEYHGKFFAALTAAASKPSMPPDAVVLDLVVAADKPAVVSVRAGANVIVLVNG